MAIKAWECHQASVEGAGLVVGYSLMRLLANLSAASREWSAGTVSGWPTWCIIDGRLPHVRRYQLLTALDMVGEIVVFTGLVPTAQNWNVVEHLLSLMSLFCLNCKKKIYWVLWCKNCILCFKLKLTQCDKLRTEESLLMQKLYSLFQNAFLY